MASDTHVNTQHQPFFAGSYRVDHPEDRTQPEVPGPAPSYQKYAVVSPGGYHVLEGQGDAFNQEQRPTVSGRSSVYKAPALKTPIQTSYAHAQEQEAGQAYAPSQQYAAGTEHGEGLANDQQEFKSMFQPRHRYGFRHGSQQQYIHSSSTIPSTKWMPLLAYRIWAWEVAASLLSIACVGCVAGILAYEQGKPLEQWQRGLGRSISPTAVVSFIGTVGKSACLVAVTEIISQLKWIHFRSRDQKLTDLQVFDEASRGPWGALRLALAKNRSALLAASASVLVIAAVFVDPFIQLVFSFPSVLTPVTDATASIMACQAYGPSAYRVEEGWCFSEVDSVMQAAILSPLLNMTRSPELPCSFERCEWPTITTLGVCNTCSDLLNTVVPTCELKVPSGPEASAQDADIQCNYTLPTTNKIFNILFSVTKDFPEGAPDQPVWSSAISDSSHLKYEPVRSKPAELTGFSFISFPADLPLRDYINFDNFTLRSFPSVKQAMQCNFDLCARTFTQPSYANSTARLLAGRQTPLIVANVSQANISSSAVVDLAPSTSNHPPMNTTFQINYCEYMQLGFYLAALFSAKGSSQGIDSGTAASSFLVLGLSLNQFDDISALMQHIADSMTETIRTSVNATAYMGTGFSTVTYISITWAWLLLPVALVLLTFVMLIVVILRNNARGVPAWKSSSLALLFHDLEGWDKSELQIKGPEDIKAQAATMTARVSDKSSDPSFFRADSRSSNRIAGD